MGTDLMRLPLLKPGQAPEEAAQDLRLIICGRAVEQDDPHEWARGLLEACGLLPYESAQPVKARAEQAAPIKYPVRGQ